MAMITFEDLPSTNTPLNAANLNNNFNEVLNLICPIGKVEVFFDNADHSDYLGFTWERTCVGRMPVGYNSSDADFDTIGETGGEKTHTLTVQEMPSHNHRARLVGQGSLGSGFNFTGASANAGYFDGAYIESTGGGQAHNIMNPYQVVAYWKRTA